MKTFSVSIVALILATPALAGNLYGVVGFREPVEKAQVEPQVDQPKPRIDAQRGLASDTPYKDQPASTVRHSGHPIGIGQWNGPIARMWGRAILEGKNKEDRSQKMHEAGVDRRLERLQNEQGDTARLREENYLRRGYHDPRHRPEKHDDLLHRPEKREKEVKPQREVHIPRREAVERPQRDVVEKQQKEIRERPQRELVEKQQKEIRERPTREARQK